MRRKFCFLAYWCSFVYTWDVLQFKKNWLRLWYLKETQFAFYLHYFLTNVKVQHLFLQRTLNLNIFNQLCSNFHFIFKITYKRHIFLDFDDEMFFSVLLPRHVTFAVSFIWFNHAWCSKTGVNYIRIQVSKPGRQIMEQEHQHLQGQFFASLPLRLIPFQISVSWKKCISALVVTQPFRDLLWPNVHLLCTTDVSIHRVREKCSQKFRFSPRRFGFFSYILPFCIFSHFVISKLAFFNSLFLWLRELGWIILQPCSPFHQNHCACFLNSTHFHCENSIVETLYKKYRNLKDGLTTHGLGKKGRDYWCMDVSRCQISSGHNGEMFGTLNITRGKPLCTIRGELLKSLFQKLMCCLCKTVMSYHSL